MSNVLTAEWYERVHEKYLEDKRTADAKHRAEAAWAIEVPLLEKIIPELQKELSPRYEIRMPLGVGGVSVVLEVFDKNLETPRALKFARPTPGREPLFAEVLTSEISRLREAIHSNVIAIFQHGEVSIEGQRRPYYIMEYIAGARNAAKYFSDGLRTERELLDVLAQVLSGLLHLHEVGILHGDVKLENIMVGEKGRAVISDLGSARRFADGPGQITLIVTRTYAHPDLIRLATGGADSDTNRVRVERFERDQLRPQFDLYALGRNIPRLLASFEGRGRRLNPYTCRYLKLMAARLLDGRNSDAECVLGLPRSAFNEIKYQSTHAVELDFRKLIGTYSLANEIPELNQFADRTIQTSSLSPTPFTSRLGRIISHPLMRRLAGVPQLGFISLVYPTGTHSRLEHVLGTFTNVVRYCNALINDALNPLFKQLMTTDDIVCLILAGLFHDLGQYPLAHDLQDACAEVFEHEEIALGVLEGRFGGEYSRTLCKLIREDWGVEPTRIAAIIGVDPSKLNLPLKDRILSSIISGPIDADKLDYLVRDSVNLNVPFGLAIDFERLLQCLTVVYKSQGDKVFAALGIHEKGRVPAETVAFARYAMFGTVYWHHTSRAAKAMLHRAVWEGLPEPMQRTKYHSYREDVIAQVMGDVDVRGRQQELFDKGIHFPKLSQLQLPDREIVEWVASRTSDSGVKLLSKLVGREVFRRVLVLSKSRSEGLWHRLLKFRTEAKPKDLVRMQVHVQEEVVSLLRNPDSADMPYPTSEAVGQEPLDRMIRAHEDGEILILIDIPTEREGTRIPLEYLPEADRRDIMQNWTKPVPLEDSIVWRGLHDAFLEAVGKIRVFGDPEFRDTLEAGVKREKYVEIIEGALREFAV